MNKVQGIASVVRKDVLKKHRFKVSLGLRPHPNLQVVLLNTRCLHQRHFTGLDP